MTSFFADFPVLSSERVKGARLYANRQDMMIGMNRKLERVAEIGVALGYGTEALVKAFQPKHFAAFDLFQLHEIESFWGQSSAEHLENESHYDYYYQKFNGTFDTLELLVGDSSTELSQYPDGFFDLIYIDGDHSLEGVKKDSDVAITKVAKDGILFFNDYVMIDSVSTEKYGIIPCVNDIVMNKNWYVIGFAFQDLMFCDIALSRIPADEYYNKYR